MYKNLWKKYACSSKFYPDFIRIVSKLTQKLDKRTNVKYDQLKTIFLIA